MKGALSSKPSYQFDENGNLVANEGESEEALATRESIVLYKEGFSSNHPADVAVSNGTEIPPEALDMEGQRIVPDPVSEETEANDSNDPSFSRPTTEEEVEENDMEEAEEDDSTTSHRGRRKRR